MAQPILAFRRDLWDIVTSKNFKTREMKIIKKNFFLAAALVGAFSAILFLESQSQGQTWPWARRDNRVQGRVLSRYGPVANARVRIAGSEKFALTNRHGEFMLPSDYLSASRVFVTAGKEGWFNNGQVTPRSGRMRDIFLNPIYLNDRPDYRFISPVTCSRCHVNVTRYWDQSKMAHTTSNKLVLDMFYGTDAFDRRGIGPGYKLDNPGKSGNCATCHAPSVAARARRPQDLRIALRSRLTEWDGISCDYCHKVRKIVPDGTKPSGMSAILERQASYTGASILVFGPYDDVVVPPMAASYSPLYEKAEFCSVCHAHFKKLDGPKTWNYSKVYTDLEWEGFGLKDKGRLPIQTTYYEWKQWQERLRPDDPNKGKKCQDCHMGWRKEMLPYDNYIVDGMARRMWGTYRSAQTIHPHHFDGATEVQLKTALSMELEGEVTGKTLSVHIYITNTNGGHWVPTGETMRSIMLLVNATDSKGRALKMIKGSRLPEWTGTGAMEMGNYAGRPGVAFARILRDDMGNLHVPFWRATGIASDNRIRPKSTVTLDFEFALADPEDEPTAEAQLVYRPVIRPWAIKKNWATKDILITSKVW